MIPGLHRRGGTHVRETIARAEVPSRLEDLESLTAGAESGWARTAAPLGPLDPLDLHPARFLERADDGRVRDRTAESVLVELERLRGEPLTARIVVDLAFNHTFTEAQRADLRRSLRVDLRALTGNFREVRDKALVELERRVNGNRASARPAPAVVTVEETDYLPEHFRHEICAHQINLGVTGFTGIHRRLLEAIPDGIQIFRQDRLRVLGTRQKVLRTLVEALSEVRDRRFWAVGRFRHFVEERGLAVDALVRAYGRETDSGIRDVIADTLRPLGVNYLTDTYVTMALRAADESEPRTPPPTLQERSRRVDDSYESFARACARACNPETWKPVTRL